MTCYLCQGFYADDGPCDEGKPLGSPHRDALSPDDVVTGLQLAGLVGIVDPPRPEAIEAIALCRTAGVHVAMITGDHAGYRLGHLP